MGRRSRSKSAESDVLPETEPAPPDVEPELPQGMAAIKPPSRSVVYTNVATSVPRGREITLGEFVRGRGPLGAAFATELMLKHKRTLKHTRQEWDEKWAEFMTRKR